MKSEHITLDRELSEAIQTVVTVENDTQRILREALMRLKGGRKWVASYDYRDQDGRMCVGCACSEVMGDIGYPRVMASPVGDALIAAANSMGHPLFSYVGLRTKSFAEIKTLFSKAIKIAGPSPHRQ